MTIVQTEKGLQSVASAGDSAPMIGADGKLYNVPKASHEAAIANGWKFAEAGKETPAPATPTEHAPETLEEARADLEKQRVDRLAKEYGTGDASALDVGLSHFTNELSFGALDALNDKVSSNIEKQARAIQGDKHQTAATIGDVAGFAASLALPGVGEVGDAAKGLVEGVARAGIKEAGERTLARSVAASATKVAAEGAIYSAPRAAVEAATGDPEQAAETMLWGTGLGAVLGTGGALGKAAVGAGAEALSNAARKLTDVDATGVTHLDSIARNVLGITDKQAQKLGPEKLTKLVELADQEGVLQAAPAKRAGILQSTLDDSNGKILEHYDNLDSALEKDPKLQSVVPSGPKLSQEFNTELLEKNPHLKTPIQADNLQYAHDVEKQINELGLKPSISDIHSVRAEFQDSMKELDPKSLRAQILDLADNILKTRADEAAQGIYSTSNQVDKFADYVNQKERLNMANVLKDQVAEQTTGGKLPTSLSDLGFNMKHAGAAAIGAGLGHATGIPGAGVLGGMIGAKVEQKFGEFLSDHAGWGISKLRAIAKDPANLPLIGGFMAKGGQDALDSHLNSISKYLSLDKTVARTGVDANPYQHLIGDSGVGMTKDQQYNKITQQIGALTADQQRLADSVGKIASTFAGTSINLASMVAAKNTQALQYLNSQIPKNPNPPKPFQKDFWQATAQQKADFLTKVSLVNNPMLVWNRYQAGTMGKLDREVLSAVYPRIYQKICDQIMIASYQQQLPYDRRLQLSAFTGTPLDTSIANVGAIQQAITVKPPSSGQPQGGSQAPHHVPQTSRAPSLLTESQRRTSGQREK